MSATRAAIAAGSTLLVAALLGACGSIGGGVAPTGVAESSAASPTQRRAFTFRARVLPPSVRRRVTGSSWRPGCPVTLGHLRYVEMTHWGFDREVHRGQMIVNATAVRAVRRAFGALFSRRFPIRRMHLVDAYGADDFASIEADNTSAFNCRRATGSTRWSEHAYGRAIDVNPIENPYVYANGTTSHPASRRYLDRSVYRRGMAVDGRALVDAFDAVGWGWGGRWSPARDLQHFSATGR